MRGQGTLRGFSGWKREFAGWPAQLEIIAKEESNELER
jgi:hypothetical protein